MDLKQLFLAFSLTGGIWIMYLLIGLSILSIGVIIERLIYFYGNRPKLTTFHEKLHSFLQANQTDESLRLTQASSSPEARILKLALSNGEESFDAVEQKLQNGILQEQQFLLLALPLNSK